MPKTCEFRSRSPVDPLVSSFTLGLASTCKQVIIGGNHKAHNWITVACEDHVEFVVQSYNKWAFVELRECIFFH